MSIEVHIKRENEALRRKLRKHRRKPSGAIGYLLLFLGATALISSVIFTSSILAFIGLGLTFWGALLHFIRPVKFVSGEILDSMVISSLSAVDKVISELNYKGKAIYLLPRHLKGLSEVTVYIPSKDKVEMPTAEGLFLPSAGTGLMSLYEKELRVDFSKVNLEYLQHHLPQLLIEDLEMFEVFEMKSEGNVVHVKMKGSIYQDLCNQVKDGLKHVCQSYGCPLCASVACALTRSTDKPLQIEKVTHSNKNVIEAWYRFVDNYCSKITSKRFYSN